ncbi:NYN domain-containing protein [Larkinella punicea]|uniref:NYN domain-containing protein n=1 Tax=Larkinella punicea TaxID=2315727 RepID=A0A368JG30_9BACT|nr:NYN domain-containing protein [Larkinella punicea]RCR66036.1 NYN domain-containing protein [Larkinella punicea]
MHPEKSTKLTRIAVIYDGNYFLHVSNYYNYSHERRSRISISGLHEFIRAQVAQEEETDFRLCQIVDAHYFRGRLNAHEASQRGNQLFYDRLFDDILMSEGVVTHYLPVKTFQGSRQEKGIDVWLALETFELTISKKFDVVVLITADGDYVPLIRKLNTLGTRLMVLSWDFEYYNDEGEKMVTRTSQDLLAEVSYPVAMHEMIDTRLRKNDPLIQNLFVKQSARVLLGNAAAVPAGNGFDSYTDSSDDDSDPSEFKISTIRSLKNGYGFINYPPNNLFFHYTSLNDIDFNELQVDDEVKFRIGKNAESKDIAIDVHLESN